MYSVFEEYRLVLKVTVVEHRRYSPSCRCSFLSAVLRIRCDHQDAPWRGDRGSRLLLLLHTERGYNVTILFHLVR